MEHGSVPIAHLLMKLKHGEIEAKPMTTKPNKKLAFTENMMQRQSMEHAVPPRQSFDSPIAPDSPRRPSFEGPHPIAPRGPRASFDTPGVAPYSPRGSMDLRAANGAAPRREDGVLKHAALYVARTPTFLAWCVRTLLPCS